MKDLESKLAERDAMIRVLQKHTYEKDVSSSSYQSMLGRSPHHTPHPSLHGNSDLGAVLGTSVSREELGKNEPSYILLNEKVMDLQQWEAQHGTTCDCFEIHLHVLSSYQNPSLLF